MFRISPGRFAAALLGSTRSSNEIGRRRGSYRGQYFENASLADKAPITKPSLLQRGIPLSGAPAQAAVPAFGKNTSFVRPEDPFRLRSYPWDLNADGRPPTIQQADKIDLELLATLWKRGKR